MSSRIEAFQDLSLPIPGMNLSSVRGRVGVGRLGGEQLFLYFCFLPPFCLVRGWVKLRHSKYLRPVPCWGDTECLLLPLDVGEGESCVNKETWKKCLLYISLLFAPSPSYAKVWLHFLNLWIDADLTEHDVLSVEYNSKCHWKLSHLKIIARRSLYAYYLSFVSLENN